MRRFEYTDDKSAKFWEIDLAGTDLHLRWGRIGTSGQSQTKGFADADKAGAAMMKLVQEKQAKGYAEIANLAEAAVAAALVQRSHEQAGPDAVPADSAPIQPSVPAAAPAAAHSAPAQTLFHEVDRVFEALRVRIADPAPFEEDALTLSRIGRDHGIGEAAAHQVRDLLEHAGLVASSWYGWSLTPGAREIAIGMAKDAHETGVPATVTQASGLPPWLAQGEPLHLGAAVHRLRKLARATRRHPQALELAGPLDNWRSLRELAVGSEADLDRSAPSLRAPFEAVWQSLEELDGQKAAGTAQTDAVLLALCHDHGGYRDGVLGAKCIDYLVGTHGLPYVLDVLIASMACVVDQEYTDNGTRLLRLRQRVASDPDDHFYDPLKDDHWRLRAHLAAAPQDVYEACAALAQEHMPHLVPGCQIALALLFPDLPGMSHDLIDRLCAEDSTPPSTIRCLMLNATDPAALAQARQAKVRGWIDFWSEADMVATILLEHRLDAVRWLAPGAGEDHAGDALARIGTPEALDALARVATSGKPQHARFMLAVERWPVAATVALARLLAGQRKDEGLLLSILVDLLRQYPTLPSELQAWLEPAPNSLLQKLHARLAGPLDVATAEDLPEVLADVPWLRAKKKPVPSLQLLPLPLAPIERWDEGEKEEILAPDCLARRRYRDATGAPDAMARELGWGSDAATSYRKAARDAIAQGDAGKLIALWRVLAGDFRLSGYHYWINGFVVAHLPPELGIPFWNATAGECPCYHADFLAATWGVAALPGLAACIDSTPSDYFGLALSFGAVELAPVAARVFARLKTLRALAGEWLTRFPEHAACGLIAPALGKPGAARDNAAAALRYLAGKGHGALLDEVAGRYGQPGVLPALHAMLNENPLDRYPNKRAALPEFWKPSGWNRPVLHNGKALSDAALETLGTMMMFPTTEEVYAGLHQVKAACTAQSLADFAWDCFSAWLIASAPNKENWAMTSLGVFGTGDTARKLTPYIRAWPGEAAHARAVAGLDVLAAIGSDVALMLLNGIAQKLKFKGLQDKAREKIEAIAEARGLTPEELEDRLAPDLGLDEGGSLVLDFGPRAFKVGFDEALKPYVREWQDGKAGARLPDLPKPKKTDDEELAKAAVERFKLLKKDARTIASQQVLRLETAMCARRRWSPEVFARFLAGHPLVRHLVRRLVWGVYAMPVETIGEGEEEEKRVASYGGTLQACFRVSEDSEYTDAADDPFTLPEGEHYRIGLPHALELSQDQAAEFGQLLADYELLQPFAQLGRDTHALTTDEQKSNTLSRWAGTKVPTGKVLGLSNVGWIRGPAMDGGSIWTYTKRADAWRSFELDFGPGIIAGLVGEFAEQTLGGITLQSTCGYRLDAGQSDFGTVDPIIASELIRDMERLCS